ncbi:hypothetical protein, partial [Salmonella sp. s54412]|uniref:hypothetical protein n=1 Tax=Salmonella sp. s54412 TaxID=3160128 RepID=UPI0037544D84
RFVPMSEENIVNRSKRSASGQMMVEVETFYKGKEMVMPMMKTSAPEDNEVSLNDTFSEDERIIEASFRQSMFRKPLEKNRRYIYFGRMFRHRNKTMKAASEQFMVSNLFNTMAESAVTKIMRRGFRKKYTQ